MQKHTVTFSDDWYVYYINQKIEDSDEQFQDRTRKEQKDDPRSLNNLETNSKDIQQVQIDNIQKQEVAFSHEWYIQFLNQKIQESRGEMQHQNSKDLIQKMEINQLEYYQDEPMSMKYLDDNTKDIYQTEEKSLNELVEYRRKMEKGLKALPQNSPIDFVESGMIMSEERPFNYLNQEENKQRIPLFLGQNIESKYKKQLHKHTQQLKSSQSSKILKKDYLKQQEQQIQYDNPLFLRSYQNLIANISNKQNDEIVEQKYHIASFFKVNECINEMQEQVQKREDYIKFQLKDPSGDIPFNLKLAKVQQEQNKCSFLLGQLFSLENNKIHSPYFERIRLKIKIIYQLMDKLQQIQDFYSEVFEIYDFLLQNMDQISKSLIQEAYQKFQSFIQKQRVIFLTKQENDTSKYKIEAMKKLNLCDRFKTELLNILEDIKSLEEIENNIKQNFVNQKDIQKLFSYQKYYLSISQMADEIKQEIEKKGNLLHITQILYNKVIDNASLINFKYFSEYDNHEIINSYIFVEEIYKLKKQIKVYFKRNLEFNSEQMLNIAYYYQQLVQQRRKTSNQLLRKIYRNFLDARKAYLKKIGKYNKNE